VLLSVCADWFHNFDLADSCVRHASNVNASLHIGHLFALFILVHNVPMEIYNFGHLADLYTVNT
jgi:hypothetical protein